MLKIFVSFTIIDWLYKMKDKINTYNLKYLVSIRITKQEI